MTKTLIRFAITALLVTVIAFVTTFFILKSNIDQKLGRLDKTAQLIAGQVSSANLNSILAFTNDHFIMIVHQRDGRLLFESAKRPDKELALWEVNRDDVFKIMSRQSAGTIAYPQTEAWNILAPKKVLRFMAIPDLDWVLAVELPANVTLDQLLSIYSPAAAGGILLVSLLITLCFSMGNPVKKEENPAAAPPEEITVIKDTKTPEDYLYQKRLIAEARRQLESGKQSIVAEKTAPQERQPPVPVEKEPVQEAQQPSAVPETEEPEAATPVMKPTEVYFDKLLENKKGKPQPNSIIGMALSKKSNREKLDT